MRRGRKSKGSNYAVLLLVGIVLYFLAQTQALIPIVIIGSIAIVVFLISRTPTRCSLCQNQLKKTRYTVSIEGQQKTICPTCNQEMKRHQSRRAVRQTMLSQDIVGGVRCPSCHTEYRPLDESCRTCGRLRD